MNMTSLKLSALVVLAFADVAPVNAQPLSFDNDGRLPAGWKADATGGRPAEWQVVRDANAVSAPNVLAITRINDSARGNFNLFWSSDAKFLNGNIEVSIRANSGDIDQGGGLIWRARDANNYYIARYNPLERNLRLYYVKDGARKMLTDAPGLSIGSGEWFTLKIAHHGERIQAWLNGKKLIETTDATFTANGGIGVWAKADAASSFDNLTVRHTRGAPVTDE